MKLTREQQVELIAPGYAEQRGISLDQARNEVRAELGRLAAVEQHATEFKQHIAVSIFRPEHDNGISNWIQACQEAEELVKRFGFDLWAVSAGSAYLNAQVRAYHVMGESNEPLGPPDGSVGPFEAVRRELGVLKHRYDLAAARVAFGAVDTIA